MRVTPIRLTPEAAPTGSRVVYLSHNGKEFTQVVMGWSGARPLFEDDAMPTAKLLAGATRPAQILRIETPKAARQ